MQTFLPYPDFAESARCLDSRRLGKQRVEVLQILNAIQNPDAKGWKNHPCTLMWRNHVNVLIDYGIAICVEWTRRGFQDTVKDKLSARRDPNQGIEPPMWLGNPTLHANHRAKLLHKDPEFYGRYGWLESATETSYWPV